MDQFKLGKAPAVPNAVKLKLANYLPAVSSLPTPPKKFGHANLIADWRMLANDKYGDCVFAGAAHETSMWNAMGGHPVSFSDQSVLSDYSAVTGFDPATPESDRGTNMDAAAKYRRNVGIVDDAGVRHKVDVYMAITAGDVREHLIAMYLFGAVGIGINFPRSAMAQFNAGKTWGVVKNSPLDGGHYVPLVARDRGFVCVTWGRTQRMTDTFFKKYNDESIVYLSSEALINGRSMEGFDTDALLADLAQITAA